MYTAQNYTNTFVHIYKSKLFLKKYLTLSELYGILISTTRGTDI